MTCLELLQMLKGRIEAGSHIDESEILTTDVHGNSKDGIFRVMIPLEGKTKVVEIKAKELCIHEGL